MREEFIKKASILAHKAHKSCSSKKLYLVEKSCCSLEVVFSFPGSWDVDDWYSDKSFGVEKVDLNLFPSLRSIRNDDVATVNSAFLRRFKAVLASSSFVKEVDQAVTGNKAIVFTGHSSGGPISILATLWFLDRYIRPIKTQTLPQCITFGSPLAGDRIIPHALIRENWDQCFVHFVSQYDIIPRVMLAPLSSIEHELPQILQFLNPKSPSYGRFSAENSKKIFTDVLENASKVASHVAINLMESTNQCLRNLNRFIKLSPYRPFGKYMFYTENGNLVVVKDPDAVLQILFYSFQLSSKSELDEIGGNRCLKKHLEYKFEVLHKSLEMQNGIDDYLEKVPLSSDGSYKGDLAVVNSALNDLGLSTRARLCLRAGAEQQKQKHENRDKINSYRDKIRAGHKRMQDYQRQCETRSGYYDSFKIQDLEIDFKANVERLELAGMWDEIIEMLKRNELPDEFESTEEWIELGTQYRRLVEPIDIANFYRHSKNEDTGAYTDKARPKRYRYAQRWLEHAERVERGSRSESCSWARIEELKNSNKSFEEMREEIRSLEKDLLKWEQAKQIGSEVFLKGSTFSNWWSTLPPQHKVESRLKDLVNK